MTADSPACAHCGLPATGYASVGQHTLCHPFALGGPDCYRRVTVYGEPLGVLQEQRPLPDGVKDIRKQWPVLP